MRAILLFLASFMPVFQLSLVARSIIIWFSSSNIYVVDINHLFLPFSFVIGGFAFSEFTILLVKF